MYVLPLQDEASGPDTPLIALYEFQQGGAQLTEDTMIFLLRQVGNFRADGSGGGQPPAFNLQVGDIRPFQRADLQGVPVAVALDAGGNPDGIEILFRIIAVFSPVFDLDKQKLTAGGQVFGVLPGEEILLKIIGNIG